MMAKKPTLVVWLYGQHLARLSEPKISRYRLEFTTHALDRYGEGARILSLALPVSRKPIVDRGPGDWPVLAFTDGLLPEGNLREQVAAAAKVPASDRIRMLAQVGKECAGAVQILPEGEPLSAGNVRRLTGAQVDRLVADLPTYHLPQGATPQASLAGIQDKVLLTRLDDGSWGWPENGAASTHLIKPEPTQGAVLDGLIESEDWALRVARRVGLSAAHSRIEKFDGRKAIVIQRYDRSSTGGRLHQEDFCQALGLPSNAKYESTYEYEQHGSRLSRLVHLAADRAEDPDAFRRDLLTTVTFNIAIGNGDAHSKNYSVIIGESGAVELAPVYDAAPVMHLASRYNSTGHVIAGKTSINHVDVDALTDEAVSWGMPPKRAEAGVVEAFERVHDAVRSEPAPGGLDGLLSKLERMWTARSWPAAAPKQDVPCAHTSADRLPANTAAQKRSGGKVWVEPHTRGNTHVEGYWRSRPESG